MGNTTNGPEAHEISATEAAKMSGERVIQPSVEILQVPIGSLIVSTENTRKDKEAGEEDSGLTGLAQSIKEHGLLNPLTVRVVKEGQYEILAGQRRYLACKQLGLATIPVIVREQVSKTSAVALSLIENVQRADMHPLDKARAYMELREHHAGNLRQVSEDTGVSVATIQRYLDLLRLPPELQEEIGTGKGAAGVGAMAGIVKAFPNPEDMIKAFNQIGGFTQDIQTEILKRSDGDVNTLGDLVMHATEGAFDMRRCGSSANDCPHIPDSLRAPLLEALRALEEGKDNTKAAISLKEFAGKHKKRRS